MSRGEARAFLLVYHKLAKVVVKMKILCFHKLSPKSSKDGSKRLKSTLVISTGHLQEIFFFFFVLQGF